LNRDALTTAAFDGLLAVVWALLTAAALFTSWRVARRLFPTDTLSQLFLHSAVSAWSGLVALNVLLGACGMLGPAGLGLGSIVLIAVASIVLNRFPTRESTTSESPTEKRQPDWLQTRIWALVWGCLLSFAGAVLIVHGLAEFPVYWDDLMYHYPLVDQWLQSATLYVPGCPVWYNPGNGELVGLWFAAPFSGDFWVGLGNVPSILTFALAICEIGRQLELTRPLRHLTTLAALGTTIVFLQAADLENDIAAAGLFAAAVAYGLRFLKSGANAELAFTGASLGLLAGVKYYALGYFGIASLSLILLAWVVLGYRATAQLMLVTTIFALVLSGYWYARNWIVAGSPLYPLAVFGSADHLGAVRPGAWHSTLLGNGRLELLPHYAVAVWRLSGPFQAGALFAAPFSLAWLLSSSVWLRIRGAITDNAVRGRILLALLLVGSFAIFAITPFTVHADDPFVLNGEYTAVRYSQCPLVLAVVALGMVLSDASRLLAWNRVAFWILSGSIVAFATTASGWQHIVIVGRFLSTDVLIRLLIIVNLALVAYLLVSIASFGEKHRRIFTGLAAIAGVALIALGSAGLSHWWHRDFARHFDREFRTEVFSELDRMPQLPSPVIGVLDYRYYPFLGSRRQFHVVRPFHVADEYSFFSQLVSREIEVVSVIRNDPFRYGRYVGSAKWPGRHPQIFTPLGSGGNFDVYSIRRAELIQHVNGLEKERAANKGATAMDRPYYDRDGSTGMRTRRGQLAAGFAQQVLATCRPFLPAPDRELAVLDVGCGYGFTTVELAKRCREVVGIEPSTFLFSEAGQLARESGISNVEIRNVSVTELAEESRYDLVVLDNVLEHLPEQPLALERISASLKRGGVLYIVVPNKLWPLEVHYRLPFLSYLPLPVANWYLRLTGRGTDYTDASYAPTVFRIRRLFAKRPELSFRLVPPANVSLATLGASLHYRLGIASLRWCPCLWAISKVFLIVAVKQ
jgi:2-polyprenyl-3-methyl-5-hydroxy-6-metoxy-1,4-benzoquinol methylase